jgi:hypothetical protein
MNDISILRWQAGVETEIEGAATYAQHFCRFKLAPGIGIRQYRLWRPDKLMTSGQLN